MAGTRETVAIADFIGVGALKAGTSFLDVQLRTHPQLFLPPTIKEAEFFTRRWDRGVDWYTSLLAGPPGRRRGEISPQYLFDPEAPKRIFSVVPDVRLLVNIRNPVERTYSQYKHWVEETRYAASFEAFLDDHPAAIDRSRYFELVSRYLDLFRRDQVHVIVFEDLVEDTVATMGAVYRFLGVDDLHRSSATHAPVNASRIPRFHRGYVGAKRASAWLYDHGGAPAVRAAKRLGANRVFESQRSTRFAPIPPDTRARLVDLYADDVAAMGRLIGRDLCSAWLR